MMNMKQIRLILCAGIALLSQAVCAMQQPGISLKALVEQALSQSRQPEQRAATLTEINAQLGNRAGNNQNPYIWGEPVLNIVAGFGDVPAVNAYLANDAEVEGWLQKPGFGGKVPLHAAAEASQPAVLKLLVDKMVALGLSLSPIDGAKNIPLHLVAHNFRSEPEQAKATDTANWNYLVNHGATPDVQDGHGTTAQQVYSDAQRAWHERNEDEIVISVSAILQSASDFFLLDSPLN